MVVEGLRAYVQAVAGLSEPTRQRARELAQALLASSQAAVPPGATALPGQVTGLAEDILATARNNRSLLLDLVRAEVERSIGALGLTPPTEVDRMRRRILSLERRIEQLEGSQRTTARKRTTKTAATKTAATKTAATKTATAKKASTGKRAATRKTPAKKQATS